MNMWRTNYWPEVMKCIDKHRQNRTQLNTHFFLND